MTASISRMKTLALLGATAAALMVLHAVSATDSAVKTEAALPHPQCNDGIDNDRDGHIDFPEDNSCDAIDDLYEGPKPQAVVLSLTDGRSEIEPGDSMVYTVGVASERPDEQGVDVQLVLPAFTNVIGASDGGRLIGDRVVWDNVRIFPARNRVLTVQVAIAPNAKPDYLLVAEARAGSVAAGDTTRVRLKNTSRPNGPRLSLSVTDSKSYAQPNELLRYRIVVNNRERTETDTTLRVQIPSILTVHEVSGRHTKDNRSIEWRNLRLLPGEGREFFVVARINREAKQHQSIAFKVSSGIEVATDHTTVSSSEIINEGLSVSLSDNRSSAARGEVLYYQAHLTNNTSKLFTNLDANAALPTGTEFVSASDGGQWTGAGIYWKNLTVSPRGKHVLQFAVRVRSDMPDGSQVRASLKTADSLAVDITDVGASVASTQPKAPVNLNAQYASRVTAPVQTAARGALNKYADKLEVQPGGRVVFTVSLKNTTNQVFRNVSVTDKIDTTYMKIIGPNGQLLGQNGVTWKIGELRPGMEWKSSYAVSVSQHTPHGTQLRSVVSAAGQGMQSLSLNQTVYAGSTGVIGYLPKTGAGMDAFAVAMGMIMSIAPVGMQMRRKSKIA